MSETLSNYQAAVSAGVLVSEIVEARRSGRIDVRADGRIDPAALEIWRRNFPSLRRVKTVTAVSTPPPALPSQEWCPPGPEPVPPPPGPRTSPTESGLFLFPSGLAQFLSLPPFAVERLIQSASHLPRRRVGRRMAYNAAAFRSLVTARPAPSSQARPHERRQQP